MGIEPGIPLSQQLALCFSSRLLQPLFLAKRNRSPRPCSSLSSPRSPSCPIISCSPSPLLPSPQTAAHRTCPLHQKCDLLRQEGFSPSHVKILRDNPCFRAVSLEKVACVISFLRAKGVIGVLAGRILTRTPRMLDYRVEGLERKCKFFEDLGIGALDLRRFFSNMKGRCVLGLTVDNLQKHIDFLQQIGLTERDILKMIIMLPNILLFNVERKLGPTYAFFERQGMRKEHFCKLVRSRPHVFSYSLDSTAAKLEFVRRLGLSIDSNNGLRAVQSWITVKPKLLLSKLEFLKRQGLSEPDLLRMVKMQPAILLLREDSLRRKIDYLKNVLNRDIRELVSCPTYLTRSLERRITARFTFLNELKEKGESAKTLSLNSLLLQSDEVFEKKYAGYRKWKAGYLNEAAADV